MTTSRKGTGKSGRRKRSATPSDSGGTTLPSWWGLLDEPVRNEVFAHPSVGGKQYYRYAFLGDALIDIFLRERLLAEYPAEKVGELTKQRAVLASTDVFKEIAERIGLTQHIRAGDPLSPHAVATAFESLVYGIYRKNGMDAMFRFLQSELWESREDLLERHSDMKSQVQERLMKLGVNFSYVVEEEIGPAHEREYVVHLKIGGVMVSAGRGRSIKDAEHDAALNFSKDVETGLS